MQSKQLNPAKTRRGPLTPFPLKPFPRYFHRNRIHAIVIIRMNDFAIHSRDLRFNHRLTMDVFYAYTYSTAAWFGVQTIPLIVSPKLIVMMLSSDTRQPSGPLHACPRA